MATFLTGSTGYIGAHLAAILLERHESSLNLLVRAQNPDEAQHRLWNSLQLHFEFSRFSDHLKSRVALFLGDLTEPQLGLDDSTYERLARTTDDVLHCAASLNRRSEKSCLNVNLRGTLEVVKLARRAQSDHGLRRISHVSTVAVAGRRQNEVVLEDRAVDWERSDYDPYARTKKFCEHMIRELLPDVPRTIFRPSIVLGDSRRAETTQFDMVRAFVFLAGLPVLPFRPQDRLDIVPVDFVADAVVTLHRKDRPEHDTYHLSSGTAAQTFQEITDSLAQARGGRSPLFLPGLQRPFSAMIEHYARKRGSRLGQLASLMKVFLPYLEWNTVFDNSRVVKELGRKPEAFSKYCFPLLKFSREGRFTYPYRPWPEGAEGATP